MDGPQCELRGGAVVTLYRVALGGLGFVAPVSSRRRCVEHYVLEAYYCKERRGVGGGIGGGPAMPSSPRVTVCCLR